MTLLFSVAWGGWEVGQQGEEGAGRTVIAGLLHPRSEELVNNTEAAATFNPDYTYCTLTLTILSCFLINLII